MRGLVACATKQIVPEHEFVSDRPFATHVSRLALARANRIPERRRNPRERSGYRGPNRRVIDVGG